MGYVGRAKAVPMKAPVMRSPLLAACAGALRKTGQRCGATLMRHDVFVERVGEPSNTKRYTCEPMATSRSLGPASHERAHVFFIDGLPIGAIPTTFRRARLFKVIRWSVSYTRSWMPPTFRTVTRAPGKETLFGMYQP